MKYQIELPPELYWMIGIYEQKAKIRKSVGGSGRIEDEIVIAMEQHAIQGIKENRATCNCPTCRNMRKKND